MEENIIFKLTRVVSFCTWLTINARLINVFREIGKLSLHFWLGGVPVLLSLPPGDFDLAQLACPLNDVIICLHQ
jgi:hypothetical protein